MSKRKKLTDPIPALYQSNYFDTALFNFVLGIISVRPTYKITAAIDLFIDKYNIDLQDYSNELGKVTYYRMLEKFRESNKEV